MNLIERFRELHRQGYGQSLGDAADALEQKDALIAELVEALDAMRGRYVQFATSMAKVSMLRGYDPSIELEVQEAKDLIARAKAHIDAKGE